MIIGIDIDETIFPLVESIIPKYNEKYNDTLKFEDIKKYYLGDYIKIPTMNFFKEFATDELFEELKPYLNASKAITSLLHNGNIVYFVTAGHSVTLPYRRKLLKRYFSWYHDWMLIKCNDKSILKLDVLIDDCVGNLNGNYKGIVFSQPWNEKDKEFERIKCWNDVLTIL